MRAHASQPRARGSEWSRGVSNPGPEFRPPKVNYVRRPRHFQSRSGCSVTRHLSVLFFGTTVRQSQPCFGLLVEATSALRPRPALPGPGSFRFCYAARRSGRSAAFRPKSGTTLSSAFTCCVPFDQRARLLDTHLRFQRSRRNLSAPVAPTVTPRAGRRKCLVRCSNPRVLLFRQVLLHLS